MFAMLLANVFAIRQSFVMLGVCEWETAMSLTALTRNALRHVRSHGIRNSVQYAFHWYSEQRLERYFGIRTSGHVDLESVGVSNRDSVTYAAVPYAGLYLALRCAPAEHLAGVYVDYGAGMGRAVIVAATYAFRRVIGVELSDKLADRARVNIKAASRRLKCPAIEIVTCDAKQYALPEDSTVVHLYNPFMGNTLQQVVMNIRDSLERNPRCLTLLFAVPWHFEKLLKEPSIFPPGWIIDTKDVLWPHHSYSDPNGNTFDRLRRVVGLA